MLKIDDDVLLDIISNYKKESDMETRTRREKNRRNMDAYFSRQDFSWKKNDQSREFLPKTAQGTEIFASGVKDSLATNDWFRIETDSTGFPSDAATKLMRWYVDKVGYVEKFGESLKLGVLKAWLVQKNYGEMVTDEVSFVNSSGETVVQKQEHWEPRKAVVDPDDFLPDPRGRDLYKIHVVETDYHKLLKSAKAGVYIESKVKKLTSGLDERDRERQSDKGHDATTSSYRNSVTLWEFHGDLVNRKGELLEEDVVVTIANEHTVIRKEKRPDWNDSSFTFSNIINVPLSVAHKAIADEGVSLNIAINDVVNLIIDEGIASVYGIREANPGVLKSASQLNSMRPGSVLIRREGARPEERALTQTTLGNGLQNGFALLNMLTQEFQTVMMFNDFQLNKLPGGKVTATEVIEQRNQASGISSSITKHIDNDFLVKDLTSMWQLVMQNFDLLDEIEMIRVLGGDVWDNLTSLTPEERYSLFGKKIRVNVFGISAMLEKQKTAQRLLTFAQIAIQNPAFRRVFVEKYSPEKIMRELLKAWNIPDEAIRKDSDDVALSDQDKLILEQIANAGNNGNGNRFIQTQDLIKAEEETRFPTGFDPKEAI